MGKVKFLSRTVVRKMLAHLRVCRNSPVGVSLSVLLKWYFFQKLEFWAYIAGSLAAAHTHPAWLASGQSAKSIWSSWRCVSIKNQCHQVAGTLWEVLSMSVETISDWLLAGFSLKALCAPCSALCNLMSRVKAKAAKDDKPRSRKRHSPWQGGEFLLSFPASLFVFSSSLDWILFASHFLLILISVEGLRRWCSAGRQCSLWEEEAGSGVRGWVSFLAWPITSIILGNVFIFCENTFGIGCMWELSNVGKVPCIYSKSY